MPSLLLVLTLFQAFTTALAIDATPLPPPPFPGAQIVPQGGIVGPGAPNQPGGLNPVLPGQQPLPGQMTPGLPGLPGISVPPPGGAPINPGGVPPVGMPLNGINPLPGVPATPASLGGGVMPIAPVPQPV